VGLVGGSGHGAELVGGLDLGVGAGREPVDPLRDRTQGQVSGEDEGDGVRAVGSLRGVPVVDENSGSVESASLEVLQRLLCL
jgi:hypothetical protein